MSDDGKQHRSKVTFWAVPRGTVMHEPQPVVKLKPAEYERRVKGEADDLLLAQLKPAPLRAATLDDMIEGLQKC